MKNQQGQVILILVLIMTVALAIGISVVQRSLSDIATSSKVEQSSRAFSAAEAGIEKALTGDYSGVDFTAENNSMAVVSANNLIPAIPAGFNRQDPMECPPKDSKLAKEDIAQIWLADPGANLPTCAAADNCYKQNSLDVYWGDPAAAASGDQAALEVTVVNYEGGQYKSDKWYLDQISRDPDNGFDYPDQTTKGDPISCPGNIQMTYADGTVSTVYQCKKTISLLPNPILLRARMLYNSASQPFAVQAVGTCGKDCSVPPQATIMVSTGTAGQTQRKIQVCQTQKVVPPYFDYAVFSAGSINKQ